MTNDSQILDTIEKRRIEPLSHMMERFHADLTARTEDITVREIVAFFGDRGVGALLFVFGAPMSIPIPLIPGVSFIFSLPLLILGGLMVMGTSKPWVPAFLANKMVSREWSAKAMEITIPVLKKIENFSRPRLPWMLSDFAYRWTGIVTILMAISIMFPLPFSNTGPGFAIVVMAVARIMHDGAMALLGALGGLLYCFILYYSSYSLVMASIHGILKFMGMGIE